MNTELLRRDLGAPLHHQVFSVLRSGIMSGRYTPGSYLPGEDTLTLEFGVSRATIRRAMQSLEGEKLIERRQGRGTRVVYDNGACHVPRHMGWFGDPVQEMETILLSFDTVPASPDVARELGMQPGDEAVRLVRLRSANREPLRVMTSFLPRPIGDLFDEADLAAPTLLEVLLKHGRACFRAEDEFGAVLADREAAILLKTQIGAALLETKRIYYGEKRDPLCIQHTLVRPDRTRVRQVIEAEGGLPLPNLNRQILAPRGWQTAR